MTIQSTIESVERLLSRKQTVPSKIIHDLLTDCKALLATTRALKSRVDTLEQQVRELKAAQPFEMKAAQ
jgi:polyhydroxyalkanoate synthesis regulator phasin